ncbi:MAG: succinyl-diaminopimelate desuccinylase [Kineosporiaceae bacterium]
MPVPLPVADPAALVESLVRIGSVSGDERAVADSVEAALRPVPWLEVVRDGDCVVARTDRRRPRRVVVAGHVDTVPLPPGGLDTRVADGVLRGRGAVDMLGGVAMALHVATTLDDPGPDVTYVFYDGEEVEAERNGLLRLARNRPGLLAGDVALLGEPTDLAVEGGCQGTVTVEVGVAGTAAHAARAWRGRNAVHEAAAVVARVAAAPQRRPVVGGLEYREGMQVVRIDGGGPARNVVPDRCTVVVNHRFAPDRDVDAATAALRAVVGEHPWRVVDAAPAAAPGLDRPELARFAGLVAARTGRPTRAKLGWTDVARFTELGVPAVNFGPGHPELAHHDDEHVALADVVLAAEVLREWLADETS